MICHGWLEWRYTLLPCTLRKLYFHFLSNWMGYDRGDSFPFNFESNGIPFDIQIPFNLKGNGIIVFSVYRMVTPLIIVFARVGTHSVHRILLSPEYHMGPSFVRLPWVSNVSRCSSLVRILHGGADKGQLTSKLNSEMVPVLPSLIFPFHLVPFPVHPTGFSFYFGGIS